MSNKLSIRALAAVLFAFVFLAPRTDASTLLDPNFTDTTVLTDATHLGNNPSSPDGQVNGMTSMAWAPDGSNRPLRHDQRPLQRQRLHSGHQ